MKYKSIELINYAGIYNGMGLTQIKIDFTQCIGNKIIIRGSNGSGKTTLMNAINPNPDSNDKFIPTAEARKNIVLEDNGIEYSIRYIHPVTNNGRGTTRGYISKLINGEMVELNPNGNISSCKDIIYDKLGFDSGFGSLSQLSSEDRGLVDKKPVERKKLINSITESLETYNSIYRSLSKKSNTLKGLINSLIPKIDMIGDDIKVAAQLQNIEAQILIFEKDRDSTIEAITATRLQINDAQNSLQQNKYEEIVSELSAVDKLVGLTYKDIQDTLNEFGINSVDKLQDFLIYLEKQISAMQTTLSTLKAEIPVMLTKKEEWYKQLLFKQEQLNSYQSEHSYNEVISAIEQYRNEIAGYESVFNKMGLLDINLITKDEFNAAMEALGNLIKMVETLMANYDRTIIYEDVFKREKVKSLIASLPERRKILAENKSLLASMEKELAIIQSKRDLASELVNRPSSCTIDDCPYIAAALMADLKFPEDLYNKQMMEISRLNFEIASLESTINQIEQAMLVRSDIAGIERELAANMRFINKLPVRADFKETFLTRALEYDQFLDIKELYKFIDCGNMIEQYKLAKDQLAIYDAEFKIYESKAIVIEALQDSILELSNSISGLEADMTRTNDEILDKEKQLITISSSRDKVSSVLSKYKDIYLPNYARRQELISIKSSLDIGATELQRLNSQLSQLNTNIGSLNSDIKNLSEQREKLKHSLLMLSEYKADLEKYNKEFSLIEKVKYYSSPNTGIQSIFIGIYMNKILSTANELLGMLFGGEFVLQPFIVNESEFKIPCLGDGLMHDDISSMSTAQKSMISMIISFALLRQSSSKYNIICIDELDGGLDTSNRAGFVNLLDNLMAILNCEQAFIISHNNELDTSMADIIALKNNSGELINGHVIWHL